MTVNRIAKISLAIILLALFSSCIKDDNATVLLPLPIGDIQGVTLPDGMIDHIHVNEGTDPPGIMGKYVADAMTIDFASDEYWNNEFYTLYMSFTSVVGRHTTTYLEKQNSSSASTTYSRVIGSGNDFTVYFISDMADPRESWSCKMLTIISGTVSSSGIDNFEYSNAMIEKTDPYNKIMAAGDYHIFNNNGKLVRRAEW